MPRAAPQRKDRRRLIAEALYRCISDKGYAETTLRDVAERAGMSPSHVGYYFENKGAILEYYAALLCERNIDALPTLEGLDLEEQVDAIAGFCLGRGRMSPRLLGVIQEFAGLAVHDARLHEIKARDTEAWRAYFEAFFDGAGTSLAVPARDAARLAHAILVGLNTNTFFDEGMSREQALADFRRALRVLAGLQPIGGARRIRRRLPQTKQNPHRRLPG